MLDINIHFVPLHQITATKRLLLDLKTMKNYIATVTTKENTFTYEFGAWKSDEQSLFSSFLFITRK